MLPSSFSSPQRLYENPRDSRPPSEIDGLRAVPDFPRAFFGGGDQEVPLRLGRDDEVLLGTACIGEEDEFDLPPFHDLPRLRMEIAVPDISAAVDQRADFDLALLRACEDLVGEVGHRVHISENVIPGKKPKHRPQTDLDCARRFAPPIIWVERL